jgi:alanyl-tRNA synthetase
VLAVAVNTAAREAGHSAARLVRGLLDGRGGGTADTAQDSEFGADRLPAALVALPDLLSGVPGEG